MIGQGQAREHPPVRVVGRRGVGPRRVDRVRRRALPGGARPHRAVHELRHGRLAELRHDGVRRGQVRRSSAQPTSRAGRARQRSRTSTSRTTRVARARTTTPTFSGRERLPGVHRLPDIPAGGLFTGAEGIKTAAGGRSGAASHRRPVRPVLPHRLRHVRRTGSGAGTHQRAIALEVNSDLIAYAQLTFAFSTESVNGVPGRQVPGSASSSAPAGQAGSRGLVGRRLMTRGRAARSLSS